MNIKQKIKVLQGNEKFMELIRFCIVGAIATGIDTCIYYTINSLAPYRLTFIGGNIIDFSGTTRYRVAMISGYILSLIANYFMTVMWTFKAKPNAKNAIGVVAAHLFNLFVVRFSLMYIFVDICNISSNIAYVPTLVISTLINFVFVRFAVKKFSSTEQA